MDEITERIQNELLRLQTKNQEYIGYPLAKDFNYEIFAPFLNLQINNVGDPFVPSSLGIDTKKAEKEVIRFFIRLLQGNIDQTWGYVTNGGSEGNLYGLYLAREAYPKGMVYYSESTHYSVRKNLHLLNIPNIVISAQDNGEIDYDDLERSLLLKRDQPAIFFLNIGTTMKEGIDDLNRIKQIIKKLAIKDYYIHCDAALLGVVAPFRNPRPKYNLGDGADSVSISGHKFIGSPIPCGVVLCKNEHKERVGRSVAYVGTKDTTITGSRNGLSPLMLWYAIRKMGVEGLRKRVLDSIALADYLEDKLNELGVKTQRNPDALTVVFEKPVAEICTRYQLAVEDDYAHILCMPGIEKSIINSFLDDLSEQAVEVEQEQSFEELLTVDDFI